MKFYVCSFGGSGSWMLAQHLSRYGEVRHVHSRSPPARLCTAENEHFTTRLLSPHAAKVLFVYRDPIVAMCSVERRHSMAAHCRNIECAPTTLEAVAAANVDLFGLAEFFMNYTTGVRNYPIVCIKYETLASHLSSLHALLGLPLDSKLTIKETACTPPTIPCYADLQEKMRAMPPIYVA